MSQIAYKIGDLRRMITESKNEFEPKIGTGVEAADKENNKKAVNDIKKETGKFDGGIKPDNKKNLGLSDNGDFNRTTLDVQFDEKPPKSYVDRVKAQAEGYNTVEEKKNSTAPENGGLDFEGNKEFLKQTEERGKKIADRQADIEHSGLKSHHLSKDEFRPYTVYGESKKPMKRLYFKNTVFLNEHDMRKRIPDTYKQDGMKFVMKDKNGTEYVVEWKQKQGFNYGEAIVESVMNKGQVNEQIDKIKQLFAYNPSDSINPCLNESVRNESPDEFVAKMKQICGK